MFRIVASSLGIFKNILRENDNNRPWQQKIEWPSKLSGFYKIESYNESKEVGELDSVCLI